MMLGQLIPYKQHMHPLVGIAAERGTWQCDMCKRDEGAVRGHCAACDWDLCAACLKKETAPAEPTHATTLHIHPLEYAVAKAGWFVNYQCDVCKNSIGSGAEKYSCVPCSFDVCGACYMRGGPPPTPVKASSSWWGSAPPTSGSTPTYEVPSAKLVGTSPSTKGSGSCWCFQRGLDGNTEMKLKYNSSISSSDIEKAIRARFLIPDSDRLVVIDSTDNCDVVLSAGLDRGVAYRVFTTTVKGPAAIPLPK